MGLKPETADIINEPTAAPPTDERENVAKATGIVALGNISSRILGLVREIILSNLFGPGVATDAFNVAIIVPRSLYDLLIGGHVNSALVPVLSEYADREDRSALWELVNVLLGLMVMSLSALVIVLEIFAPMIAAFVAGNDAAPETITQATDMLRITAPALFFLALFAVMSGLLYSLKRFTMPAFAASVFNGTIVIMTLALADSIGITAAALGWFVGAIVQFAIQFPELRDARIMPRFRGALTHPGVRTIAILYLPVMFSLGLDVLINRPFSYNLAAGTGEGNVSIMQWATTLIQFPHGLVATAISIAVLPTLSQQATRKVERGLTEFKDTLGLGLRLSTALILPATVGLFVLATPVVALIFEHGEFGAGDTVVMSQALRLYLIGLPFAAIDLLLVFAFYAQQDTVTPAIIGVVSLVAYIVTALLLLPVVGFLCLMIADSVKHLVHSSISAVILWRRMGGLGKQRLVATTIRAVSVSLVMGGLAYATLMGLETVRPPGTTINELIHVVGGGIVGVVVYGVLGHLSGLEELHWMVELVRRKLGV